MLSSSPQAADELAVDAALWLELVEDARTAPSPHKPWEVAPRSATEVELPAPVDRLLPVENHDGRFLTAGMGIFVEALDAAARGLQLEFEPFVPEKKRAATPGQG